MIRTLSIATLLVLSVASARAQEAKQTEKNVATHKTVTFSSLDGVVITADIYAPHNGTETPLFLLFHQAESSRGEYREIATLLTQRNLNAMAVDLRTGNRMNGVNNVTHKNAGKAGKKTNYLEAYQDMVAALRFAKKTLSPARIYVLGASYSASLALRLAAEHPNLVSAVFAFSPAEYFRKDGVVLRYAKSIRRPTFITSAQWEHSRWKPLLAAVRSRTKVGFIPKKTAGFHGSRALLRESKGHQQYWTALDNFLKLISPSRTN